MPNISVAQTSFVGGEFSPSLYARTDIEKYGNSVRLMRNFFPHAHGGASNRGGTQFVGEAKYKDKKCRMIPFQFSVIQSYMLEFGHNYIRFYKDGGRIVENDVNISGISKASQGVVTSNAHGYSNGDWVILYVEGMTELNGKIVVVSDKNTNDYKIKDVDGNYIDTTNYTTFTSGVSNRIYQITTTYIEADLPLIKFNQSADTLYITHPSYAMAKLTRTGHTAWTLTTITIGPKITAPQNFIRSSGTGTGSSYLATAVSTDGEESIASGAASGGPGDTFTWSAPASGTVRYYNVYKDDTGGGSYGWIGYTINPTFREPSGGIIQDGSKTPPVTNNPFSGSGNYPGCSTFFEQRLVVARPDNKPQTVFGSVIGNIENFNKSSPVKDDDSYEFTMNATQMNEIRWLVPLEVILVGTSGGEFKLTSGSGSDAITPSSVNLKRQSNWGVDDLQPIVVGNTVIFLDGSKARVRDLTFNITTESYSGNDLSIFAEHLLKGYSIISWAFQRSPDGILWCVRNDGKIVGLTYLKEHEVFGWHRHDTDGYFESIANISVDEGVDEVWCVVKRTIDGVERRYVERFMPRLPINWDFEYLPENGYMVDCGLSYDGWNSNEAFYMALSGGTTWAIGEEITLTASGSGNTPFSASSVGRYFKLKTRVLDANGKVTSRPSVIVRVSAYTSSAVVTVKPINRTVPTELRSVAVRDFALMITSLSGLEHLEGKAVAILADGSEVTGKTITDGAVSFPAPFAKVHIGLGYNCDIETLDFEYATETGTVQDKNRQVLSAVVRFEKARELFIGPSADKLTEYAFRSNELLGEPIDLFTGDKELEVFTGDDPRQARLFMRVKAPVPTTILSIIPRMTHGEK